MRYGLDYLAGARYRDVILAEHPHDWGAGFFYNVDGFGSSIPVIRDLVRTGRCPLVRVQAVWDDAHTWRPNYEQVLLQAIAEVNQLKKENPRITFQISPMCEHSLKGTELTNLLKKAKAQVHGLDVINSPGTGDYVYDGSAVNEGHGNARLPVRDRRQYSFDGTSCVDADVEAFKRGWSSSDVFFLWVPQFNLRLNTSDNTPRAQRKAVPTADLIKSVVYLANAKGGTHLPARHLWKSHADQHEIPPEQRALKPVCIIPEKVSRLELATAKGKLLALSAPPQPYADGRWRYYFPVFGYQLALKAVAEQGNAILNLRGGGKVLGQINPAFREGEYRV